MRWPMLILGVGLALAGCYTVQIRTQPSAATVTTRGGQDVSGAGEVTLRPFGRERLTVTAVKHRPLEVPLGWRPFGWMRRSHQVEVRLVEEHGLGVLTDGEEEAE